MFEIYELTCPEYLRQKSELKTIKMFIIPLSCIASFALFSLRTQKFHVDFARIAIFSVCIADCILQVNGILVISWMFALSRVNSLVCVIV